MLTALSWTELRRGSTDLAALLAFRRSGLAPLVRRRLSVAGLVLVVATIAVVVVPAYLNEPLDGRNAGRLVGVLPTLYLGFLVLTVLAAISSGGGREIVPRDEAVAFPISPVTEHVGALLLAPLNIAWIVQTWTLLGATAYVIGPAGLAAGIVPVLLWILFATAAGQLLGWTFEGVRRGVHGVAVSRSIALVLVLGVSALVLTDRLVGVLDASPTVRILIAALYPSDGSWGLWAYSCGVVLAMALAAILLGLVPARWALQRPQREELRLESGIREPRPHPRSDLAGMVRVDRTAIWRSVPLRRGLMVLATMPGAIALAGDLTWDLVVVLPGLVSSGAALLFGVNAWCLDGRGALWRDSLPVDPAVAYYAKVVVLFEITLLAAFPTVLVAGIRAGAPTAAEFTSIVMATLVVAVHVVAASMRWSVTRPFAIDLRSARATPAPPVVMAGYSARLALRTTIVGLLFSATSLATSPLPALVLAVPLLLWPAYRIANTATAWADPQTRARVIATVAS